MTTVTTDETRAAIIRRVIERGVDLVADVRDSASQYRAGAIDADTLADDIEGAVGRYFDRRRTTIED